MAAASEPALRCRVKPGLPLAEAATLLPRHFRRDAVVEPHDPAGDRLALARLAEHCEQFSPIIGWETVGPRGLVPWFGNEPAHMFLDVSGIPSDDSETAANVQAACEECDYSAAVAVGPTVGAAWALAASLGKCGVTTESKLRDALAPLPVARLRLSADTLGLLARLGLTTVEQLLTLSRAGLAERFDPELLLRIDQALGLSPETVKPHRPAPRFEAACDLELPTERRDEVEHLIAELAERLAAELRDRNRGAVRLAAELGCYQAESVAFAVGLFRPTASARQLADLLKLHCERLPLAGPVSRIRLRADRTAPLRHRQTELFGDGLDGNGDWAALVERLSSRLGPRAVVRPELQADALPERAFRYAPAVGGRRRLSTAAPPKSSGHRPLRLFTPPQPVEAGSLAPGGQPGWFSWQGRRRRVARHWGPERIETGWWRRGLVRRDYYRVETEDGSRYWLFIDRDGGGWYLHGSFE